MKFKNLFSFVVVPVVIAAGVTACQPHSSKEMSDGTFQCISATITIAGKPTTTVVEWNTKTGMTRLLDSMVVTSKATGAQNVVVGWVPLGDLQAAIQEIVSRNQAMQQQAASTPQNVAPATVQEAATQLPTKKRK